MQFVSNPEVARCECKFLAIFPKTEIVKKRLAITQNTRASALMRIVTAKKYMLTYLTCKIAI